MRTPDGRLTVKGLMPGQQLIQTSDGKLQVVTTTQLQQSKTTTQPTPAKTAAVKNTTSTPGKKRFLCMHNDMVLFIALFSCCRIKLYLVCKSIINHRMQGCKSDIYC